VEDSYQWIPDTNDITHHEALFKYQDRMQALYGFAHASSGRCHTEQRDATYVLCHN
jgi:hypothetical protein